MIQKLKIEEPKYRISEGPCTQWFDFEQEEKMLKINYSAPKVQHRTDAPILIIVYIFKAKKPEMGQELGDTSHVAIAALLPKYTVHQTILLPPIGPSQRNP